MQHTRHPAQYPKANWQLERALADFEVTKENHHVRFLIGIHTTEEAQFKSDMKKRGIDIVHCGIHLYSARMTISDAEAMLREDPPYLLSLHLSSRI